MSNLCGLAAMTQTSILKDLSFDRASSSKMVWRAFAWLGRCRRLAKDWECLNRKALALLKRAAIASCCASYAIQDNVPGQTLSVAGALADAEGTYEMTGTNPGNGSKY